MPDIIDKFDDGNLCLRLLHRIGIDPPPTGAPIACSYPDCEAPGPSWRWDPETLTAFCTCRGPHGVLDVIVNMNLAPIPVKPRTGPVGSWGFGDWLHG